MDIDEIRKVVEGHLCVRVSTEQDEDGDVKVKIRLMWDDDEFDSDHDFVMRDWTRD